MFRQDDLGNEVPVQDSKRLDRESVRLRHKHSRRNSQTVEGRTRYSFTQKLPQCSSVKYGL